MLLILLASQVYYCTCFEYMLFSVCDKGFGFQISHTVYATMFACIFQSLIENYDVTFALLSLPEFEDLN